MKRTLRVRLLWLIAGFALLFCCVPEALQAETKKGLLVYDTIYSSTPEVAYWLKAIIGNEQPLDVKHVNQVITVRPYEYVLLGSYSRWEKPSPRIYAFVDTWHKELAKKQVCYFLTCGDWDETTVLKVPGRKAHLVAGRNYLYDIMNKYPDIKPVVIAGFGGRQVMPSLDGPDSFMIWMLGKLAKGGAAWEGLDIYESLVPERVEAFGNAVRQKVLGLKPLGDVRQYRCSWQSQQPGSLADPSKKKYTPRPYTAHTASDKMLYRRFRIRGNLDMAIRLIAAWAKQAGVTLREQRKTFFNVYYHAVKTVGGTDMIMHIVAAEMPEDPGAVHVSLRSYDRPEARKPVEALLAGVEKLLCADGRKITGR